MEHVKFNSHLLILMELMGNSFPFLFQNKSFFLRTLFQRKNLTVITGPITVTKAVLDGQQVNNIYVVNINQQFSVSVMPIDRITRKKLGLIQWSNWRWTSTISQYILPNYNRLGSLITNSSSRININLIAGLVTIPNLSFNGIGMYILSIRLISSNNEHDFQVISNAILVKEQRGEILIENLRINQMVFIIF